MGQLDVFGRRQHRQQEEALETNPSLTQPQQAFASGLTASTRRSR